MTLVSQAPLTVVRTTSQGYVQVPHGVPVPDDIDKADAERLVKEGYLVDVELAVPDEEPASPPSKPTPINEILADVGDDKEKAAAALAEEKARGDDARKTLVEKLEAILTPQE